MKRNLEFLSFHSKTVSFRQLLKSITFLFIYLFTLASYAQQPTLEWTARWPSPQTQTASNGKSIQKDSQGNIYVLSDTSLGFGFLKYDQNGNLLFTVHHSPSGSFSTGGSSHFYVAAAGDVYITGTVYIELDYWIYTVKFNNNGVLQWYRLYNRDTDDSPEGITADNNGDIILIGGANIGSTGYPLIIKYKPNGDTSWVRYFNPGQTCLSNQKVFIDSNNNIYTIGSIGIPPKCLILKYAPDGNLYWYKTFTLDVGRSNIGWGGIVLDEAGNIYLTGTQVRPQAQYDSYLLKLRNNGDTVWSRNYPQFGPGNFSLWGPIISSSGNSIYYTATYYAPANGYDIGILKYDSLGNLEWIKTFNAGLVGGLNIPSNIKFDKNENVYVCGGGDYTSTGIDFTILKYLPSGILQWVTRYTGVTANGTDFANDMIVDSNVIFGTGSSRKLSYNYNDAVTIKYHHILGINPASNEMPVEYKLYQNYPNPFNGSTIITYLLPKDDFIELQIYNYLGESIATLVKSEQPAGNYSIIVNMEGYASGIYFYKIKTGSKFSESKKMIYLK